MAKVSSSSKSSRRPAPQPRRAQKSATPAAGKSPAGKSPARQSKATAASTNPDRATHGNSTSDAKRYWLVKTEPESFSIDDFDRQPNRTTCWEGVRNYQARNFLRDSMKLGDEVLIYHSNADPPCAVGIAKVAREAYPDHFAWDKKSKYYDEDSTADEPRWFMVDLELVRKFPRPLPLDELRTLPALSKMELLRRGSRLSVQPVTNEEFAAILAVAEST